jgi:threonine dehydrogenase-like Zn-dependent dehydrogenase
MHGPMEFDGSVGPARSLMGAQCNAVSINPMSALLISASMSVSMSMRSTSLLVQPGESVVIYGAGPVGLMAACSAALKGASQVMVVDTQKNRLQLAEKVGAIAIDDSEGGGIQRVARRRPSYR